MSGMTVFAHGFTLCKLFFALFFCVAPDSVGLLLSGVAVMELEFKRRLALYAGFTFEPFGSAFRHPLALEFALDLEVFVRHLRQ